MTTQASDLTPAALVTRARAEMAQGAYLAAQTSALIAVADALVAEPEPVDTESSPETPDRRFVDDYGRTWEWCGGVPGTWAWRITAGANC